MNPLSKPLGQHNGPNCFDDEEERKAIKNFLYENKEFQKFVFNQFGITAPVEFVTDPLGERRVDAGLTQDGKLIGLIEVDYYKKWNPNWPYNYRWCHALVRKIKYWEGMGLPYIGCTFNTKLNKILVSTDEMQKKYMHTKKMKKVELNGKWEDDLFLEIPLSVAKKFGEWTEEELRRVS